MEPTHFQKGGRQGTNYEEDSLKKYKKSSGCEKNNSELMEVTRTRASTKQCLLCTSILIPLTYL